MQWNRFGVAVGVTVMLVVLFGAGPFQLAGGADANPQVAASIRAVGDDTLPPSSTVATTTTAAPTTTTSTTTTTTTTTVPLRVPGLGLPSQPTPTPVSLPATSWPRCSAASRRRTR